MLPVTENLEISKETGENDSTQNNQAGDTYSYYIALRGSLLTPEQKEYKDLRIVDLLPNEVKYEKITSCGIPSKGVYLFDEGKRYQPEIIDNYHNSGRTAVIHHITYETLTKYWEKYSLGTLTFKVRIREDARPGTVRNDVYVVGDNLLPYSGKTGGTEDIYDLNNNGLTSDRIAYDSSYATIMTAQSIYAEKFIAPAGSDSWNKQGLALKAGSVFDYLLKVTNETSDTHTGLVVYDTLPANGDRNINGAQGRNSEFPVRLREAIEAPAGYTVYYTTSQNVYQSSMSDMVSEDIWLTANEVESWSEVTAFKLEANEGTVLSKDSPFQVRIPARVPDTLSDESMALLKGKTYQDQKSGTIAFLQAINSFGFKSNEASNPKESNTVWVRIPFAGFKLQKVDNLKGAALEGAEFALTKNDDASFQQQTAVSGADGFLEFRHLTEGTYTLKETKVPVGYRDDSLSLTVTITQNAATMEYAVDFGTDFTGAGTGNDPLRVVNVTSYELPATGGAVTALYAAGGLLLTAALSLLLYIGVKRKKA